MGCSRFLYACALISAVLLIVLCATGVYSRFLETIAPTEGGMIPNEEDILPIDAGYQGSPMVASLVTLTSLMVPSLFLLFAGQSHANEIKGPGTKRYYLQTSTTGFKWFDHDVRKTWAHEKMEAETSGIYKASGKITKYRRSKYAISATAVAISCIVLAVIVFVVIGNVYERQNMNCNNRPNWNVSYLTGTLATFSGVIAMVSAIGIFGRCVENGDNYLNPGKPKAKAPATMTELSQLVEQTKDLEQTKEPATRPKQCHGSGRTGNSETVTVPTGRQEGSEEEKRETSDEASARRKMQFDAPPREESGPNETGPTQITIERGSEQRNNNQPEKGRAAAKDPCFTAAADQLLAEQEALRKSLIRRFNNFSDEKKE